MQVGEHLRLTGTALKRWLIARSYNALIIGTIWLLGLLIIGVPFAPFWAFLGGAFQFIPNLGPVLALIGPAFAAFVSGGFYQFIYVLMLYAAIAVVDGLIVGLVILTVTPLLSAYTLDIQRIYPGHLVWGRSVIRLALAAFFFYLRPRGAQWQPAGHF